MLLFVTLLPHIPYVTRVNNIHGKGAKLRQLFGPGGGREAYRYKIEQNFLQSMGCDILERETDAYKTAYEDFGELDDVNDAINKMLAIHCKTYLVDDILVKVNRATMSVSLEGRDPLLDYRISEFASQLPSNLKLKDKQQGKYLLKKVAHKYLPEDLMNRPKQGFSVPIQA